MVQEPSSPWMTPMVYSPAAMVTSPAITSADTFRRGPRGLTNVPASTAADVVHVGVGGVVGDGDFPPRRCGGNRLVEVRMGEGQRGDGERSEREGSDAGHGSFSR